MSEEELGRLSSAQAAAAAAAAIRAAQENAARAAAAAAAMKAAQERAAAAAALAAAQAVAQPEVQARYAQSEAIKKAAARRIADEAALAAAQAVAQPEVQARYAQSEAIKKAAARRIADEAAQAAAQAAALAAAQAVAQAAAQSEAIKKATREAAVKAGYVQAAELKTGERVLKGGRISTRYEAEAAIATTNFRIKQAMDQYAKTMAQHNDILANRSKYTPESLTAYDASFKKYQEDFDEFMSGSRGNLVVLKGALQPQFTADTKFVVTYNEAGEEKKRIFDTLEAANKFKEKHKEYVVTYVEDGKEKTKTFKNEDEANRFIGMLTESREGLPPGARADNEFIDTLPSAQADTSWIYTTPKGEQTTGGAKGLPVLGVTFTDRSALRGKEARPLNLAEVSENIGKVGEAYENIFRSVTKPAEETAEKLHGLSIGSDVFRLPVKAGIGAFNAATFIIRPAEWAGATNLITALMTPEKGEIATEYRARITAFVEGDIANSAERERIVNQLISVMPQTSISTTDIEAAKAVRNAFAESIVNDPAGFVAQVAGGFIGGYIVGDAIQNIPQIKNAISRLNIEQRMWNKIEPLDEVNIGDLPIKEMGEISPFKGGKYDTNVPIPEDYSGPVLWARGTWSSRSLLEKDPLHLGGTAVVALREIGTKNIVGYMTWEEAVKTTGGIPELFGLMGVITLSNGTKVYAEPGVATIPLNRLDTKTLQATIMRLDAPTLQKAITRLDETTIQKIDVKTLLLAIPKLDTDQIRKLAQNLDITQIQGLIQEQTLKNLTFNDVITLSSLVSAQTQAQTQSQVQAQASLQALIQSLTTTQAVELVQDLTTIQVQAIIPYLTQPQIEEIKRSLPPLKRTAFIQALERRKLSAGAGGFVVRFTDYSGSAETISVKAQGFHEAYIRARNTRRTRRPTHSVDIQRGG